MCGGGRLFIGKQVPRGDGQRGRLQSTGHCGTIPVPVVEFLACPKGNYVTGFSRLKLTMAFFGMTDANTLNDEIKTMLVENLMLQVAASEITDDLPLFGPEGLGLDSVDALQLVVALDKNYGVKIPDPATAREVLHSVHTIAQAVRQKQADTTAA
jgi:acyl carrier protein